MLTALQQQMYEHQHVLERNTDNLSTLQQDRATLCATVAEQRSRLQELQGKEILQHTVSVLKLEEQERTAIARVAELRRQTEKLTKDQCSIPSKVEAQRRELQTLETQVAEKRTAASAKHIAAQKQTR